MSHRALEVVFAILPAPAFVFAPIVLGQEEPPRFSASVDLVTIDAVVIDGKGHRFPV